MNDYVLNVGPNWDELEPVDSASSVEEGIAKFKDKNNDYSKFRCKEICYEPEDDVEIDEVVWRNTKAYRI